jgi:orotate phosphoribosyltransferase
MSETESPAYRAFESAGAFLRGHFVYTSGRHGSDYLEKFRILEDPRATAALVAMMVERFAPFAPELVAGPSTGGMILAFEAARQLGINAVYVERGEHGGRVLRRGFEIPAGARVLVVDDVVTTGGSLAETMACLREAGANVIGIGVMADRTSGRTGSDVPFFACLSLDFPSYSPETCPLCAQGLTLAPPRGTGKKAAAV